MRLAILSDVHSNLQALTRAFEVIDASHIDAVCFLGDLVGYGANPNECLEIIRKRGNHVVRGNHDHAVLNLNRAKHFSKAGRAAATWTRKHLSQENLAYLETLPFVKELESCTLVHAAPQHPQEWIYIFSLDLAEEQFGAFTTPYCFIGHTHVPAICGEDLQTFEFRPGLRFLVNVGSIGQPRDGKPMLSFGILDTERYEYTNVRADYDVESAANAILDAGLPSVLARRLYQGV